MKQFVEFLKEEIAIQQSSQYIRQGMAPPDPVHPRDIKKKIWENTNREFAGVGK